MAQTIAQLESALARMARITIVGITQRPLSRRAAAQTAALAMRVQRSAFQAIVPPAVILPAASKLLLARVVVRH